MSKVAFLGTGLLGSGMVETVLRQGHAVTVWNRTGAKARALESFGATFAASPEAAVVDVERVHNSMIFVITAGIADLFAMAKGDFDATFELTMARKDIRLMIEAAGQEPLTVLPAIAARMDEAIAAGHGKDDMGAIAAAGVRETR